MSFKGVVGDSHSGEILDRVGNYDVIRCVRCGFTHVHPIPSDAVLAAIYRDEYYTREKPDYFKHALEDKAWWHSVYAERYRDLEQWLGPDQHTILDIGSGPGLFLLAGQRRGWQATGIEPSRVAVDFSRESGCRVIHGFISGYRAPKETGRHHCVHLSNVLEHLQDPAAMLGTVRALLHPHGLVQITVPNDYNRLQTAVQTFRRLRPWWLAPPHHINYFSFASLKMLLKRCGFIPLSTRANFPMELFLLAGWNYVDHPAVGRKCHGWRKQFELRMTDMGLNTLQRALYRILATTGLGREITVTARKAG